MKDSYPPLDSIPPSALVAPELQPDYSEGPPRFADCDVAEAILRPPGASADRAKSVALVMHEAGRTLTFGELDAEVSRLADAFVTLGIRPGERIAFRSGNRSEGIVAALAAWRAGAVVVPIPLQAQSEELNYLLLDTGARMIVAQGSAGELLDPVLEGVAGTEVVHVVVFGGEAPPGCHEWSTLLDQGDPEFGSRHADPDSLAIIWHTGGTTGRPKACYHTHRRFLLGGYSIGAATGICPGERWAAAAPIGHALGFIYHTIYTLLHGATIVLIENFQRPQVLLEAIEQHQVDTFTAIAATWARMKDTLEADTKLSVPTRLHRAYAMWQSASSSEVYDWWHSMGVELLNNFGSTAFATWVLVPRIGEQFAPGSLGRAAPGYEVIATDPDADTIFPVPIGEPGQMAVRGPTGLTYWNRDELQRTAIRDGWTLSDDLIQFDANGNAAYLGRTDFLISTAGYKVAPVEVETVLAGHPAVREVAVIGTPDPIRHEIVAAFVVLVEGREPSAELRRELQDLVKRSLAPYKYPRRVDFIEQLPRDSVGKVQPRRLLTEPTAPSPGSG